MPRGRGRGTHRISGNAHSGCPARTFSRAVRGELTAGQIRHEEQRSMFELGSSNLKQSRQTDSTEGQNQTYRTYRKTEPDRQGARQTDTRTECKTDSAGQTDRRTECGTDRVQTDRQGADRQKDRQTGCRQTDTYTYTDLRVLVGDLQQQGEVGEVEGVVEGQQGAVHPALHQVVGVLLQAHVLHPAHHPLIGPHHHIWRGGERVSLEGIGACLSVHVCLRV